MSTIPYEAQKNCDGQRTCGAAALNMIYKAFGIVVPQEAVWRVISLPDAHGGRFARTYRLAFDASLRGVSAVAFKALDPVRSVQEILESGSSVIMNHRLTKDTGDGHYTVALRVQNNTITFHDPEFGPSQTKSVEAMRTLWQPKFASCEITGNFLIALAQYAKGTHRCKTCGTTTPASVPCPACQVTVPLQPAAALGCSSATCASRLWEVVLCPFCDAVFPIS